MLSIILRNSIGLMWLLCTLSFHFVSAPGFACLSGVGVVEEATAVVALICGTEGRTERRGRYWLRSCGSGSSVCPPKYAGFWLVSLWITHKNTSVCYLVTRCKVIPTAYRFILLCWFWSACFCQFLECVTFFSLRRISSNKMSTNVTQHLKLCMFFFSYCKHGVKAH